MCEAIQYKSIRMDIHVERLAQLDELRRYHDRACFLADLVQDWKAHPDKYNWTQFQSRISSPETKSVRLDFPMEELAILDCASTLSRAIFLEMLILRTWQIKKGILVLERDGSLPYDFVAAYRQLAREHQQGIYARQKVEQRAGKWVVVRGELIYS